MLEPMSSSLVSPGRNYCIVVQGRVEAVRLAIGLVHKVDAMDVAQLIPAHSQRSITEGLEQWSIKRYVLGASFQAAAT